MRALSPHRVRVKICGINSAEAFDAAAEAGVDWIGFVFFPPSPRFVTPTQAAALSARRAGGPLRVGLFVDPSDDEVAAALAAVRLDVLQLYADAARVRGLRARFGVPVWRAIGVETRDDLPGSMDGADGFVIEAKAPAGATRPGGNAVPFDWSVTAGWISPGPWLLAGGLGLDTVEAAIRSSGSSAVDVSSGVETSPGKKDGGLIWRFVAAAQSGRRATNAELSDFQRDLSTWKSPCHFARRVAEMTSMHGSHIIDQAGSCFRDAYVAAKCAAAEGTTDVRLGNDPPDFELRIYDETVPFEVTEILKEGRKRDSELKTDRQELPSERFRLRHHPEEEWTTAEVVERQIHERITEKAAKGYAPATILAIYLNVGFVRDRPNDDYVGRALSGQSAFAEVWVVDDSTVRRFPRRATMNADSAPAIP